MDFDIPDLFREVADLSPEQREQYFATHGVPSEVRDKLEDLLGFDKPGDGETLGSLIGEAAIDWAIAATSPAAEFCGPYQLIRLLAKGGMGAVYLGRRADGEVDLEVAVKFVNAAIAGHKDFEERFLKERQILASLTHPGIARLLDAGRTADRSHPYLVMEYVDGIPIDVYCETLDLSVKLRLFLEVCDAVSYSHRNLIIHRDLKPSNILVDKEGKPKLLDFGIAKILDDADALGLTRERLFTPEYASPEQAAGHAHTTATDIYSLGAVLRRIVEAPGPYRCPKDLDFIIKRSMREDAASRYPSVDAMAEDIQAMLESRPVKARSGNMWYRARRFFRRHWLPATALTAAVISLSVGLHISNRDRRVAQQRFTQLRLMANSMLNFDVSIRTLPGATKAREQLVNSSVQYLDGLSRDANIGDDAELALEVAGGYNLMGQVQGVPVAPNLGKTADAELSLGKAAEIVNRVLQRRPALVDALFVGAQIAANRASVADRLASEQSVIKHSLSCESFVNRMLSTGKASQQQKLSASLLLSVVAVSNSNQDLLPSAVRYLNTSITLAREAGPKSPVLVQALSTLSVVLRRSGDLDGAMRITDEAQAVHANAVYPNELARSNMAYNLLSRRGMLLDEDDSISLGRPAEALVLFAAARDVAEEQVAKDPNDVSSRGRVASMCRLMGDILRHTDSEKALAAYDRCVTSLLPVTNSAARRDSARCLAKSAAPLRKLGRDAEARRRLDQAFEIVKATKAYPPPPDDVPNILDAVMRTLGLHELETGHPEKAREFYERLLQWIDERKIGPSTLDQAYALSRLYVAMEKVYADLGLQEEFEKLDARRTETWLAWDKKLPGNPFVKRQLELKVLERR